MGFGKNWIGWIICCISTTSFLMLVNSTWAYLLESLKKMGFSKNWIGWIICCISTTSFLVLVNSTSTGFFRSFRGLRKGILFCFSYERTQCFVEESKGGRFYFRV